MRAGIGGSTLGPGTIIADPDKPESTEPVEYIEYYVDENIIIDTKYEDDVGTNILYTVLTGGLSWIFGKAVKRYDRVKYQRRHWIVNSKTGEIVKEWITDVSYSPWLLRDRHNGSGFRLWDESEPGKVNDGLNDFYDGINDMPGIVQVGVVIGFDNTSRPQPPDENQGSPIDDHQVHEGTQEENSYAQGEPPHDAESELELTDENLDVLLSLQGYNDPKLSGSYVDDIYASARHVKIYTYDEISVGTTKTGAQWKAMLGNQSRTRQFWPGTNELSNYFIDDELYTIVSSRWDKANGSAVVDHDNNSLTVSITRGYYLTHFQHTNQ